MKLFSTLFLGAIVSAGCTVMVNGKPRRIGGGGDDPPTAAAANTPAVAPAPAKAPPHGTAVVLRADATLARDPIVVETSAAFDTTFSHVLGFSAKHDCRASDLPSRPIASIDIAAPSLDLAISVHAKTGMQEGFILRTGDRYWEACDATLRAPKGGFPPGRYDVYPYIYVRKDGAVPFDVEIFAPNATRTWSEHVHRLTISGKLAKPMFVQVTTAKARRMLRDEHAGNGCSKAAFSSEPDVAITVEREIPGLVVRPLPAETPVLLRRETADAKDENKRYCQRAGEHNGRGPTYRADSEIGLAHQEGTFGISVGTPDATRETTVTLMISDDSTVFDPAAAVPFGTDALSIADRAIARQFPQLDVRELDLRDYAHAELIARVFAAAPRHAFVYAKHDFDKDLVGGNALEYPKKDEPLLVTQADVDTANVLAADGMTYRVKTSHLLAAPSGAVAIPATPRSIEPSIDQAISLLPPDAHALADAHRARLAKWDACRERAWEPFGRQLPSITRPAGVDIVVVRSPAAQRIEEAGDRAMDQQCGTVEARDKQTAAARKKMLVEIGKARARLLAKATAAFRS